MSNPIDWEKRYYNIKLILDEYSISETDSPFISDQAFICVKEIERLKAIAVHVNLDPEQVEALEKYSKILEKDRIKPRKEKKKNVGAEEIDYGTLLRLATSEET